MFLSRLNSKEGWFEALEAAPRSYSAIMYLDPGQTSADEFEDQESGDQVFLVIEGEVIAEFAEERVRMLAGNVLVIPAGVPHRFCNGGNAQARTMIVHAAQCPPLMAC